MMTNRPHEYFYDKTPEQVENRFKTDRGRGVAGDTVPSRRREFGKNNIYKTHRELTEKSFILTDFAALILPAALFVAAIFEVPVASGVIVFMLVVNYVAATFVYFKAHRVLDDMTAYSLPTAKVLRDGRPALVNMDRLVPGDVVFLSEGDIVPADLRLFMTDSLYINESTLTGVHSSVMKDADYINYSKSLSIERMTNIAFATTVVTSGSGRGIVVATGKNAEAVRLDKTKSLATHENLKIVSILKRYCSVWSMSMLALVFLITLIDLFVRNNTGVFDVFLTGISLAVAAMSEMYLAFGYMTLGSGIFGAMKRRRDVNEGALIKNASKLEDLKSINTLIIPKEGVITSTRCVVEKIYTSRTLYGATDIDRVDKLRATVLAGVISTGIYGSGLVALNQKTRKITPEEETLIAAAEKLNLYNASIDRAHPIIEHESAGNGSKFETTLTLDPGSGYIAVSRGSAKEILDSCDFYIDNGSVKRMTVNDRIEFMGVASSLTRSSLRVVAVASCATGHASLRRISAVQGGLTFEGFLAIREPLAEGAAQTISRCKAAGIRVIMTTERYNETDKYLAMSLGLVESEKGVLTGTMLGSMRPEMIRTNLPIYGMYSEVSHAQIASIVKMMHDDGDRVGIMAGGISGVLLLRRADVGFAQSLTISPRAKRSGIDLRSRGNSQYSTVAGGGTFDCEALKLVSDVVVSDANERGHGGLSAVVSSLEYARAIYKNLLRMVRYLTTTQLARVFMVLGSLVIGVTTLTPVQLIFSGLFVDFAAILASAFSKPSHNILKTPDNAENILSSPLLMNLRIAVFALVQSVTVLAVYPLLEVMGFGIAADEYTSLVFISFTLCQLITFAELASEKSIFLPGMRVSVSYLMLFAATVLFIGMLFIFPAFGTIFDVVALSAPSIIACVLCCGITLGVNEIYKVIVKD